MCWRHCVTSPSPPIRRCSVRSGRRAARSIPVSAPPTSPASSARSGHGKSGTCADATPLRRPSKWAWSMRWCRTTTSTTRGTAGERNWWTPPRPPSPCTSGRSRPARSISAGWARWALRPSRSITGPRNRRRAERRSAKSASRNSVDRELAVIRDPEILDGLIDGIRRFVHERLLPIEAEVAERDEIPTEVVAEMRRLGLFGLTIPEDFGGIGLTVEEEVLVAFEIGQASPLFPSLIGPNNGIGSLGLVLDGTEAQKREWLPRLASGEVIACFALTEP